MAAKNVVKRGEISLGGQVFPVKGKVRVANITVTPNPITYGDTSRQGDTQVMSQLIQANANSGSGVYKGNPRTDVERFWTSEAETRYRQMICLPPLSYNYGKPSSLTTESPLLTREYKNIQYFVFSGGKLFRWNDASATYSDAGTATGGWSSLLATLASNPVDAIIFKDYLYFAYDTATEKMVLSGGVETVSAVAGLAYYLQVWDEKLWKLYINSGVWTTAFSSLGGSATESWTVGGTLPSGVTPTQLTTFRNVAGDEVLAMLSNVGLWLYDATNAKWRQTEVRIPQMPHGQRSVGEIFRDGKLYASTGNMGLIAIQPGNPFIVTPVGLDRDDGVPADETGKIVAVSADFNWLMILIDGAAASTDPTTRSGVMNPFGNRGWTSSTGTLTLRAYAGGWSTLWRSSATSGPGQILAVSGAYSTRRVYWGADGNVYAQNLASEVHNPRFNPTSKFAPGPVNHTTSWYDYGSDVQTKIQGHFFMRTTGCSADETITIAYQTDLNESSWTTLGTISSNGVTELKPGGIQGLQCRMIRFRFEFNRGADASLTPKIEFWAADFLRVLPATYAFICMIDLSKSYAGKTPSQLVEILKGLADSTITSGMIQFSFQDDLSTEAQTYYGRISRLQGQSEMGTTLRGEGWYQMSFTVPYLRDSE